jgi:hypothetical protein
MMRVFAKTIVSIVELGAQFAARGAIHPMQAMLNYAVGVLTARMTRVVLATGLDASFGFLHDGRKPGRFSLSWERRGEFKADTREAVFGYARRTRNFGGRILLRRRRCSPPPSPSFCGFSRRFAFRTAVSVRGMLVSRPPTLPLWDGQRTLRKPYSTSSIYEYAP